MSLGHTAWQGYLTYGRGLVACKVAATEAMLPNISSDAMRYHARYIPASEVAAYLKQSDLRADATNYPIDKVQTYCPNQEILVSIERQGQLTINLLNNLAISPSDCYRQVCNRWPEFYLEPKSTGISS